MLLNEKEGFAILVPVKSHWTGVV